MQSISAAAGPNGLLPAIQKLRIHSFADHREVVGACEIGESRLLWQEHIVFIPLFLKMFACGQAQGGIPGSRLDVGQGILLGNEHRLACEGLQPDFPTGSVRLYRHPVISGLTGGEGVGDHSVCVCEIEDGNAHARANPTAEKGVAGGAVCVSGVVIDADIVSARLEGVAHAHGEHVNMSIAAVGIVRVAGPIRPGRPLVAGGPERVCAGPGPPGAHGEVVGGNTSWQGIAPHHHLWGTGADIQNPEVPAESVGWDVHLEKLPSADGLVGHGSPPPIESDQSGWHRPNPEGVSGIRILSVGVQVMRCLNHNAIDPIAGIGHRDECVIPLSCRGAATIQTVGRPRPELVVRRARQCRTFNQ